MSSRILMATVAAIALSIPAWAHDPAEAPIDTEMKAILFDPAEAPIDTEMKIILFDPAEAPIDTEMKIILFVENIQAPLREGTGGGAPVTTGQQAELPSITPTSVGDPPAAMQAEASFAAE
jgi:hypothetical protein